MSGGVDMLGLLAQKGAGFVVVAFVESALVGNKAKQFLQQFAAEIGAIDTASAK